MTIEMLVSTSVNPYGLRRQSLHFFTHEGSSGPLSSLLFCLLMIQRLPDLLQREESRLIISAIGGSFASDGREDSPSQIGCPLVGKVFAYSNLDFVEDLRPGLAFFSIVRTFLHRVELLFPMSPQGTTFLTVHPVPLPTSTEAKLDESNSKDDDN